MKTQGEINYSKNLKRFSFSSVDLFWERVRQLAAPEENEEIARGSFHHWHFTSDLLLFLFFWTVFHAKLATLLQKLRSKKRSARDCADNSICSRLWESPSSHQFTFHLPGVGWILFWRVAPHVVALAQRDVRLQRWTGSLFHFKTTFDAGSVCNPVVTHVYINRCF